MLAGAVAIGAAVLYLLDSETKSQHERWELKRRQVHRETAQQREKIQAALKNTAEYQEYKKYIEMHHSSKQTADQSFELYTGTKKVLNGLYSQLKSSGETIGQLKQQRQEALGADKEHIQQVLKQQRDIHTQIKIAIEAYKADLESFLQEVRSLNEATAQLKQHIRLNTGKAGREWYARLEQRRLGA
jgi:chromosome segregation ATPase